MTRVPFRWGPIMGTRQGDPLTPMGFEGQWSLRWDLTLGDPGEGIL